MMKIERWRTALHRRAYSLPIRLALRDGIIRKDTSVLDYGCGWGDDVHRLRQQGIWARGWDPHFGSPAPVRALQCHVVSLGYVLNVIESPEERAATFKQAWLLARDVLVIAVRTDKISGRPFRDGVITKRGTFQKSYGCDELISYVCEQLDLGRNPRAGVLVAPQAGVLYVFRTEEAYTQYIAPRSRPRKGPQARP